MRYKSFRIRNFKGIKDTTVNFESVAGASVFAFVGLNESGKTTVLEAIHSFSPDTATSELLGGEEGLGVPIKERVPRHLISDFTGKVSVEATLTVTETDKDRILTSVESKGLKVDRSTILDEIVIERWQEFKGGDLVGSYFNLLTRPKVKSPGQKRWREVTGIDEMVKVRDSFYARTPDIAYFPTSVFAFPETIFLTDRGGVIDRFYRRTFQDILDYDGRGLTIDKDIVRRVRGKSMVVPWVSFLTAWSSHDDRDKIQHVMDRASTAVSRMIFGRWNQIFGEDTKGKEIIISYEVTEGEIEDAQGTKKQPKSMTYLLSFKYETEHVGLM